VKWCVFSGNVPLERLVLVPLVGPWLVQAVVWAQGLCALLPISDPSIRWGLGAASPLAGVPSSFLLVDRNLASDPSVCIISSVDHLMVCDGEWW
jgi:hypothetical protein